MRPGGLRGGKKKRDRYPWNASSPQVTGGRGVIDEGRGGGGEGTVKKGWVCAPNTSRRALRSKRVGTMGGQIVPPLRGHVKKKTKQYGEGQKKKKKMLS